MNTRFKRFQAGLIGIGCLALATIAFHVSAETVGSCPVQMGKPYRSVESSTVFIVTQECEKRPVFNPDVFFSHFASFKDVKFVKASILASIPDSKLKFMPWGPLRTFGTGSLVKTVTDPKVYLLVGAKAHPIRNEQGFTELGLKFSDIEDVTEDVLVKFKKQKIAIQGTENVPEFLVFKYPNSPEVYLIRRINGGERKRTHITTMEELKRLARLDRIMVLPRSVSFPLDTSPIATPVTEPVVTPTPTPTPTSAPTPTPTAEQSVHGPTGGPHIDVSAIPTGHPGVDHVRIIPAPFARRVADGVGAFRTQCQMSHMNFDDPMVFPGQVGASHLHAFFGHSSIDAFLQPGHLRDAGVKSTCGGGTANNSGYWVPALIGKDGVPLVPTNNIVYYKSGYGGVDPEDVQEFPQGLRMIAGNAKSSASQLPLAYWECVDTSSEHFGSIPATCPSGTKEFQMSVSFPQCWDGKNLDSSDHKSHMAYPNNGCPSTHPVPVPAISFNIRYAVPTSGMASLRLASDMYSTDLPGGLSAHGDWWDGWDHEIVKKWMLNCVNAGMDCGGGLISDTEYLEHD